MSKALDKKVQQLREEYAKLTSTAPQPEKKPPIRYHRTHAQHLANVGLTSMDNSHFLGVNHTP